MTLSIKKKTLRKVVSSLTMLATVVSMSGIMALSSISVASAAIVEGDLIKSNATNTDGTPALSSIDVYIVKLVGTKKFKRLILNPTVFESYTHFDKNGNGNAWDEIQTVSQAVMDTYTTSSLVRVDTDPAEKVFALAPDGDIGSKSWVNLTTADFLSLAASEDGDSIYTINAVDGGNYTAVGDVTTVAELTTFYTTGALPGVVPVPVSGTLAVALSADTAASATYVRDSGAYVAQAVADFTKFKFTAGSADVKVTNLKLTRSGLSSDTDLATVYLYEGDTMLAQHTSFSSKIVTFNNAAGLFTVSAGTTKTIAVKADIAAANATVSSLILGIASASDVTSTATAVSGTFPINGNQMAVGTVTDLGYATLTNTTTFPATMDPGKTNEELWRFTVTANDQNMLIEKIRLTVVGTVASTDLANFKLEQGGTQIGSTVAEMNTSKEVLFDFSTPYAITAGQSKVIIIKGDVVSGSSRAFKLTLRKANDFIVKDNGYGVYVAPMLTSSTAFSLIDPDTSGDGTNINSGTMTVAVAADSPTGNVASAATGVSLAKFTYKATGEDIKVSYVRVSVNKEATDSDLKNGKLYWDGVQIGSTDAYVWDENTNVFSMTQIVPAGQTVVLEYKADLIHGGTGGAGAGATTAGIPASQTVVVSLVAGTTDAVGQSSLSNASTAAATAKTLTVATGALTVAKNTSLHEYSSTNPVGVLGATGVKVGSMSLTVGAGEGVTVTQIVVGDDGDDATEDFGDNFQNLRLMNGATNLSTTQGTLSGTAGVDYTFNLSPSVSIAAGAQYVVDVYADILSGAAGFQGTAVPGLEFVDLSATGNSTSADAYPSATIVNLQNIYIASAGTMTITADSATPAAGQLVMGETDVELAKLKFTAGTSEAVNVSRIEISDSTASYNSSLSNVKLYDGTTQVGSTVASFDATNDAEFVLATPWVIPAGTSNKVLTVKASVNAYPNATSGGTITLAISSNSDVDSIGAGSGTGITETVTSATGTAQDVYRTKVTVVKNSSSPSGSAVAGAGATVLSFDVTANSGNDAVVNAVAVQASGSVDTTSNGSAMLYKSTDTTTALATEAYVQDLVSVSAAVASQSLAVTGTSGDWNGIPVGATVLVNDTSVSSTAVLRAEVTAVTATVLTATVVGDISAYAGTDVGVSYRPIQPGTGKTYFGGQATLGADVITGDTSLTVSSTDGFAVGDTVVVKGYSAAGVEITSSAGGVIATITSGTAMTVSAITVSATIDFNYLSAIAANAIAKGHTSVGMVYTGLVNETVSAGATKTFVVKGDTTGATTTENLRVDIAVVGDLNWDDTVNYGVTTDTLNLPITGGTLTY